MSKEVKGAPRRADTAMIKRVFQKFFGYFPVLAPLTVACLLFSALVRAVPSIFTQKILAVVEKWYQSGDWSSALAEIMPYITILLVLYVIALVSTIVETQLMAYMTQGFLNRLRKEMFNGMQNLPIRYFDTHQHGDIMSYYTNDVDTLRQMISQAFPAFIRAGTVVICVLGIMLWYSVWMTLVVLLGVVAMAAVVKRVGGGSARYFLRQQKSVANTEGFIQEMMSGQKVIKVFCHEDESVEDFDKINDALFEDSFRANAYANTMGPIIGNIGNVLYVTLALAGGVFLLSGRFSSA